MCRRFGHKVQIEDHFFVCHRCRGYVDLREMAKR
jgi:hypothetical protein